MKLKEAILGYSGEWVQVGAASGYVYIGRREEALKGLEKESIERYCNLSINTIPKYEAKLEWIVKRCKVLQPLSPQGKPLLISGFFMYARKNRCLTGANSFKVCQKADRRNSFRHSLQ